MPSSRASISGVAPRDSLRIAYRRRGFRRSLASMTRHRRVSLSGVHHRVIALGQAADPSVTIVVIFLDEDLERGLVGDWRCGRQSRAHSLKTDASSERVQ